MALFSDVVFGTCGNEFACSHTWMQSCPVCKVFHQCKTAAGINMSLEEHFDLISEERKCAYFRCTACNTKFKL